MKQIILDILLILFSYIIPKKKNVWIFGGGDGFSFKGNPKYLLLYCLQEKKDHISYWITENKILEADLKNKDIPVLNKYSFKGFIIILRANYLFIEIMPRDIIYAGFHSLGRFKYIQTFHGMPLKKIGNDANIDSKGISDIKWISFIPLKKVIIALRNFLKRKLLYARYKLIVSSSEECSKQFMSAFVNDQIILSGFSRNDIFFQPELTMEPSLKDILKIRHCKIISYIPTFRENILTPPFTDKGLDILQDFLEKEEAVLCVKKHPYDTSLKFASTHSRIIDVSESMNDVMEILTETNLLITDYSSVFFDYAITRKPIIFYCYDLESYLKSCRGMYYDYLSDLPGPFAWNEKELQHLIATVDIWFAQEKYVKKYNEFVDRFNKFSDGKSSERLTNYLAGIK